MADTQGDEAASSHYSHLVIGTSLALSTLSAAISQSSANRVLHIDPAEYYGSYNASLTLSQLVAEVQRRSTRAADGEQPASSSSSSSSSSPSASISFPYFADGSASSASPSTIPPSLQSLDRHYSLSLSPALQPAASPSLDVLVRSQVAKYATFRLLQRTAVWDPLHSRLKPVPASKEDVFKSGELSLIEKRKLMKFLQFAATYHSSSEADPATFKEFLSQKFTLPPHLITAVMYGIALCASEEEATGPAMERLKVHLASVGRYGNSAYLVPQYGGAGEIAQGYCRAAAVHGATFILGKEIEELTQDKEAVEAGNTRYKLKLKDIEDVFTADNVIGEEDLLGEAFPSAKAPQARSSSNACLLQVILTLDRSVRIPAPAVASTTGSSASRSENEEYERQEEESPLETGLIVFPPGSLPLQGESSHEGTVTALILGEGTFCCPKGQYVVHLTTEIKRKGTGAEVGSLARRILSAAKAKILHLASQSPIEWSPKGEGSDEHGEPEAIVKPLVEAYWLEEIPNTQSTSPHISSRITRVPRHFLSTPSSLPLPTLLNTSASQSAHIFYTTLHSLQPPYPTTEAYLRKKRGGARSEAEFRGRGGVGPGDLENEELEGEAEGEEDDGKAEEDVFFFPPSLNDGGGEDGEE